MKRSRTLLAIGAAAFAAMLLFSGEQAFAGQQTFSSVSSGKAPAPFPTATSMNVSGLYFGIYPGYGPHFPYPPCTAGHCQPWKPAHPPVGTRPVPPPRPAPPRP